MSEASNEPVLLIAVDDDAELIPVRAVLTAAGVSFVVQGEHHASLMPGIAGSSVIQRRVLVAQHDLERARAALAATPQPQTEGVPLGDAVCPVDEKQAVSTCTRCGTFLCGDCQALGDRPLCEECGAKDAQDRAPARERFAARRRAFVLVWLFGPLLFALAASVLSRTAGCDGAGRPVLPSRPR